MIGDRRSLGALGVSALLHAAIALGLAVDGSAAARARDEVVRPDSMSGNTFDVDAVLMQPPSVPAPAPQPLAAAAETAKAATPAAAVVAAPAPVRPHAARPSGSPRTAEEPAEPEKAPKPEPEPEHGSVSERPRPSRRPAATGAESAEAPAPSAAAQQSNEAPATYGAAGTAASERNLAKAFTRAIPAAVSKDAIWSELPLGPAGKTRIEITIDEDGKIASAEPERQPAKQLERLLARTLILLKSGRFALSRGEGAGSERLELEATISERPASTDEFANPRDPVQLGFEPPSAEKPGRAFFTLASGRHIEIRVRLLLNG